MKTPHQKISLSPQYLRICSYFIALTLFYFLVVDSFGSAQTVFKLTGFESHRLIIPAFLALGYLRWRIGYLFSYHIERVFRFTFPLLTVGISLLTLLSVFTPPNTVFALTRLHLSQLWLVCVTLFGLLLLNQTNTWWKNNFPKVIFIMPLVCLYFLYLALYFPFDFFDQLIKEDRLIEYGQFWVLITGAVYCGWTSWQLLKKKKYFLLASFFFLCAAVLGFIAGDEVAWGQRIFGIEVNDTVKTLNRQEELTLHNLHAVEWLVAFGYVGVSFFGIAGKFVAKKGSSFVPFGKKYVDLAPEKILYAYFFLPLIFYVAQLVVLGGIWHMWSEVTELCLYSGVVFWLILTAKKLKTFKTEN